MRTMIARSGLILCLLVVAFSPAGCSSPLDGEPADSILHRSVLESMEREIDAARNPDGADRFTTSRPPSGVEERMGENIARIDAMGPATASNQTQFDLGRDLTGNRQDVVEVNLQSSLSSAVRRNLGTQQQRIQTAISETDVLAAQAIFDAVLFGGVTYTDIDQPATVPSIGGVQIGSAVRGNETMRYETGIRKPLTSGGLLTLSTSLDRSENTASGIALLPDPAYTAVARLRLDQPLLRGFGASVNTATIRITRNEMRRQLQQLRTELLTVLEETEIAYWNLLFAWRELEISQWLVNEGITLRDVLVTRAEIFDTRTAQASDAIAAVEQRQADVIRARRLVRVASDRLKQLVNDPELTVASEAVLKPVDEAIDAPISYSLREAIITALEYRPEIMQALLAIDDAAINQIVADNARLPLLDLIAEAAFTGLNDSADDAYEDTFDADFIDYILGIVFEWPVGNRAAEAGARRARLLRTSAAVAYRQAVQAVVLDVKSALRDVVTSYELIQATRSFRLAQGENLRTLQSREDLDGLNPSDVNLRLRQQETLAQARRQEIQALINFDQSLASLYRAMGVGMEMNGVDIEVIDDTEGEAGDQP